VADNGKHKTSAPFYRAVDARVRISKEAARRGLRIHEDPSDS
jgi:hypothetical protein